MLLARRFNHGGASFTAVSAAASFVAAASGQQLRHATTAPSAAVAHHCGYSPSSASASLPPRPAAAQPVSMARTTAAMSGIGGTASGNLSPVMVGFSRRFASTAAAADPAAAASPSSSSPSSLRSMLFAPVARYIHFCNTWQMTAAILTSFVLWSLGDLLTQKMESIADGPKKKEGGETSAGDNNNAEPSSSAAGCFDFVNVRRLTATAAFGVSVIGIGGYYWYRALDYVVRARWGITPEVSGFVKFTAAKLGLEFALWHPVTLSLFWLMVGMYADGKTASEVATQLRTDLPTALACDVSLWLPIDIANFVYTPVHLQVIVVNLGCLFEAVLLSYLHRAGSEAIDAAASHDDTKAA